MPDVMFVNLCFVISFFINRINRKALVMITLRHCTVLRGSEEINFVDYEIFISMNRMNIFEVGKAYLHDL